MAEYIERSYIRKMAMFEMAYTMETETDAAVVLRMIDDAPAADVDQVVHGRWMPFHSEAAGDIQYCSACEIGFDAKMAYCPHCGAKMGIIKRTEATTMRLIDSDKFILALMDASLSSVDEDTILDLVDSVPTADAVPVVRCKDCKYRDGTPGQPNILCAQMHEDDFCSYGERRAEKEPPEEGET